MAETTTENSKKRKVTAAVATVVAAALLLVGGTFAWQSINQTALNESADVINPGGRLHDDFDGTNKDVYVENFAEEEIFARVRLEEFFEITQAGGTVHSIAGTKDENGEVASYDIHRFDVENATDAYWDWQTGGSTVFMPTFNKNKDSLVADVNGTYKGLNGVVTDLNTEDDDRYTDYVQYTYGQKITDNAIYDYDSNDVDEVGSDFENLAGYTDHVTTVSEDHTATNTLGAELISMNDWMALPADAKIGEYWVYDTDGWVYWANAIKPGEATGLLLDGISLDEKMDDSWYYAINVIAQFVTADDVGKSDGTGFYDESTGLPAPSPNAEALLEAIGVDMSGEATAPAVHYLELNFAESAEVYAKTGDSIILSINADDAAEHGEGNLSSVYLSQYDYEAEDWVDLTEGSDYTYDSETNTLVILNKAVSEVIVRDGSENYAGTVYLNENTEDPEISDQPLDITITYKDGTPAGLPPTNPETGMPADGVTQIFAIGIENKDLYLGGTLTLDDGSTLSSAAGDFDVSFTLNSYDSNMGYTFGSNSGVGDVDYTFTISTINDTSSVYNGYKLVTCDKTGEKMMVLNEETGHMVMLAEDQPINQSVFVTAHATYNGVEYTSVENWVLYFVNRDIILIIDTQGNTMSYGATYTPGTESTYKLKADLLFENNAVTDVDKYPVTWKVVDKDGNEVTDDSVTLSVNGYDATLTVTENANAGYYKVTASYIHNYDDGKNKGLYDSSWTVTSDEYDGEDSGEEDTLIQNTSGNITLMLSDIGGTFDCDETVTITIDGYDDMSLFNWEIVEGVGTYAVEGENGVFTHYGEDTTQYGECGCTTTIKATLKSDNSIWGTISFKCA